MKNLMIILLAIFFMGFLSCEEDLEEYVQEPEPQEMRANVQYSGFINHYFSDYDLYVLIWEEENRVSPLINYDLHPSAESLKKCVEINFGHEKLPPGDYAAYAWWDLENDGLWHDYDPESEIVSFTIDGFNEASFELNLKDKVNSPEGWIELTIICNRDDYGPIYLTLRNSSDFSKEIKLEFDFGSWYKYDYLIEDLEGARYDIKYFMDLNYNGLQDSNEPSDRLIEEIYSATPKRFEIVFD